jgi:hypothetical protein
MESNTFNNSNVTLNAGARSLTARPHKSLLRTLLKRHSLFGGRDPELAQLDDFADAAGGYLWVTSGPGFGKTALLANWIGRYEAMGAEIVYYFISGVDGTAAEDGMLQSLCQQLLDFHGIDGLLPLGTGALRAIYGDLLTQPISPGRKLIVVLDALDEASGWLATSELFPTPLPENVSVVFSAREYAGTDWLLKLEIPAGEVKILRLNSMGSAEIGELLKSAGMPASQWCTDASFLEALVKTSERDPYYLHFLVEDIQAGHVKSFSDVAGRPSGLNRYLDAWWIEVSERTGDPAVQDLLGYLLVSLGRLRRNELIDISDSDALSGMSFERTFRLIRRHVFGDEENGYGLSRRFRDYLAAERITEVERRPYLERLVNYCESLRTHPTAYVLEHYAQHLFDARRDADLHSLVISREWYENHLLFDSTAASYLRDIEIAAMSAAAMNREAALNGQCCPLIAEELQFALMSASLRSSSRGIYSGLISALLETGLWSPSQALVLASRSSDPFDQLRVIVALAPHAATVYEDALATARGIDEAESKTNALLALVVAASAENRPELLEEAGDVARTVTDQAEKAAALIAVASLMEPPPQSRLIAEAWEAAKSAEDSTAKAEALIALLELLPSTGRDAVFSSAFATARTIEEAAERAESMTRLLKYALPERKTELLKEALAAARQVPESSKRAALLTSLIGFSEGTGRNEIEIESLQAARDIASGEEQAEALAAVIAIGPTTVNSEALMDEALAIVRAMKEKSRQVRPLGQMAEIARPVQGRAILQEAMLVAKAGSPIDRAALLTQLVETVSGSLREGLVEEAFDAARQIIDPGSRISALRDIAPYLTGPSERAALKEVMTVPGALFVVAEGLGDRSQFAIAAAALANHLEPEDKTAMLQQAISWAREIGDDLSRAFTLESLLPRLDPYDRGPVIEEALTTALSIDKDHDKADVLASLAMWLDPGTQGQLLNRATTEGIAAARRIDEQVLSSARFAISPSGELAEPITAFTPVAKARPLFRFALLTSEPERQALVEEALVSLYGLDQSRQADTLRVVAPHLPAALVIELLRDIEYSQTADWRRQILTSLVAKWAELTSEEDALERRSRVFGERLPPQVTAAFNPQDDEVSGANAVDPKSGEDTSEHGPSTVRAEVNPTYIARAFRLSRRGEEEGFALHLEAGQVWASEAQRQSVETQIRSQAIEYVLSTMTPEEVDYALNNAECWRQTGWREARVALVTRLLELGNLEEAFAAVKMHWSDDPPPDMVVRLIPQFAPEQRPRILARALAALSAFTPLEQATLLMQLVEFAEPDNKQTMIEDALKALCAALREINWSQGGMEFNTSSLWAEHLRVASRSILYSTWVELLSVASRTRRDLLTMLPIFWPLAEVLGNSDVSEQTARILQDAVQWWP